MAGYSDTPLVKKLGIKSGFNLAFVNSPEEFFDELTLPQDVSVNSRSTKPLDFVLLFVKREAELKKKFAQFARRLAPQGMIWIAWPKKSSGVTTDLYFTNVQAIGLATGLVDVKICAVNEVWSGLKFVVRLKDRKPA
ncbi:MAG: DUF3052 domain-containing protein [Acidobacteriota bacterium]